MRSEHRIRVVLVNVAVPEIADDARQPPGGLVYIATYASRERYHVEICALAGTTTDNLDLLIPEADVYGFAVYTVTYQRVRDLVIRLRKRSPNAFFVAGGPHASALPEEVRQDLNCCVIYGVGEKAFVAILDAVEAGQADRVPDILRAEPVADLYSLPFPDFQRFCRLERYTRIMNGKPVICLDSSRGCNYRCRFCNSRVAERGLWRCRSPQSVLAEVKRHLARGWGDKFGKQLAFRFNDDNFLADAERAITLCDLLKPLDVEWRIFARAEDLCRLDLCQWLAAAGCVHVGVGIESLSPVMLARMGKATRVDRIRAGLQRAREAGISTRGFFLVGFPGESDGTVAESVTALAGLALDEALVYPCIAYPGSDLFLQPDLYQITWIDPDYSRYIQVGTNKSAGFVLRTTSFGPEEVQTWRQQYIRAFSELRIGWSDERGIVV